MGLQTKWSSESFLMSTEVRGLSAEPSSADAWTQDSVQVVDMSSACEKDSKEIGEAEALLERRWLGQDGGLDKMAAGEAV